MLKTEFNPDFSGKKTIIIILLCLLNLLLIAEEITLFDCIDSALQNSYQIKNAEQNVKIYRSENLNKLFDFIPDITAYTNAKRDIDGNDIGTNNISISENLFSSKMGKPILFPPPMC